MVGEVVHLISHRVGHLIFVHVVGIPAFLGLKFVVIDGIKHYEKYEEFIGEEKKNE